MLDDGIHVDNVILSETLNRLVVKLEKKDKETFQKPRLRTFKFNFTSYLVLPQQNLNASFLAERPQESGLVDVESLDQRVNVVLLQSPVEVALRLLSDLSP